MMRMRLAIRTISKSRSREKVRFLGCIANYTTATATLTLQHAYPSPSPHLPTAYVDVNPPLSALKPTDTQFGEWVNVIGYVTDGSSLAGSSGGDKRGELKSRARASANVQAVMLWSAGAIDVGEYERVLEDRLEAEKRAKAR
ncbi:hypothetical protein FGG08_006408 [Glutinoglossum americanum]|uniref:Uncharacterized protein n=1 Tax=Glutinoglossum americanum TaxID=1670608 RepID=A0A9P8HW37_9PEZI|nr:hypothetical protein FGG08_006408 [Glutinoglossum americanum]